MTLPFTLTFAGVPFCLDDPVSYRMGIPKGVDDSLSPLSKYIQKKDLLDEIESKFPFRYMEDFGSSYSPPKHLASLSRRMFTQLPEVRVGDWYYPTTASKWSVFRGLATSSQVKAMLAAAPSMQGTFIMQVAPSSPSNPDNSSTDYTLTSTMYLLPPRPIGENAGVVDGLYLITLVDERYFFPRIGGTQLQPGLVGMGSWDSLINRLANALGVPINSSAPDNYAAPEEDSQLWSNYDNPAVLLDAIANNLNCVVVRNLDGTYNLLTASQSLANVNANLSPIIFKESHYGGDMFYSGGNLPVGSLTQSKNVITPKTITVTFPKYVIGNDPVPHFYNTRYQDRSTSWYEDSFGDVYSVAVTVNANGVGNHIIHDTAKATYKTEADAFNGSPTNSLSLSSLASQIASDRYAYLSYAALDALYPGTLDWTPEGFHDIVWTYSARYKQGSTRITRTYWNDLPSEMQHGFGNTGSYGGKSVAQCWRDLSGNLVQGVNLVTLEGATVSLGSGSTTGGIQEVLVDIIAGSGTTLGSGSITSGMIASGAINQFNFFQFFWPQILNYIPIILASGQYNSFITSGNPKLAIVFSGYSQASMHITGFSSGVDGQLLYFRNDSPSNPVILDHLGASSGEGFYWPWQKNYTVYYSREIILEYNASGPYWQPAHPVIGCGTSGGFPITYGCDWIINGSGLQSVDNNNGSNTLSIASGGINWYMLGSGSVTSGAIASGALASGMMASGFIANLGGGGTPITATYQQAILGTSYPFTPSWANVGLSLSIPGSGVYLLSYSATCIANWGTSPPTPGYGRCRLYDTTAAAAVSGTDRIGCSLNVVVSEVGGMASGVYCMVKFEGTAACSIIYFASGAVTIDLQAEYVGSVPTGGTSVLANADGDTSMNFVRIN